MEKNIIIKNRGEIIKINKLIEKLKEYKNKELMLHVWIRGKFDKTLCGSPAIYADMKDDDNKLNIMLVYNEKDLHEHDFKLELWTDLE